MIALHVAAFLSDLPRWLDRFGRQWALDEIAAWREHEARWPTGMTAQEAQALGAAEAAIRAGKWR